MKDNILFKGQIFFIMGTICLFLLGSLFIPFICKADYPVYPDMKMNATPNPVGSGAKAMGMGGAFISIADDATAASWNPGGLLQVLRPEVSIVGSWFSGRFNYEPPGNKNSEINDNSSDTKHLNYFSFVLPMIIFQRNIVFSLNYQHLYEFSMNIAYKYEKTEESFTIFNEAQKRQKGSLNTISPAYAVQINPSLYIGVTANFWPDNLLDNGWENINKAHGVEITTEEKIITHTEIYERYRFSGFNMHLGFLYKSDTFSLFGENRRFRIGGVIKTPFNAEILHEYKQIWHRSDPNTPNRIEYTKWFPPAQKLSLKMPISYGLGFSLVFSDYFIMGIDLYRTRWDHYLIKYPSGKEISPINKMPKAEAFIKPTTQIRLGGQYRYIYNPKNISINFRSGIFYDPEPATGQPDEFYGISIGAGITYNNRFSFDVMYQYRFGKKKNIESLMNQDISSKVKQHYVYTSLIYYL